MIKLVDIQIEQGEDILISGTAKGDLLLSPAKGGSFFGEKLRGRVLPLGVCSTYTPSEGINIIHAPFLLETDDGANLFMQIDARLHLRQELEEKFLAGEAVSPETYYYKGTVRFEVGHPQYKWLETKIFVCEGKIDSWQSLRFSVYEL